MKSTGNDQAKCTANRRRLKPQVAPDFSGPALEWRRMFAEIWGTFLLVLLAAGGGVVREPTAPVVAQGSTAVVATIDNRSFVIFPLNR